MIGRGRCSCGEFDCEACIENREGRAELDAGVQLEREKP